MEGNYIMNEIIETKGLQEITSKELREETEKIIKCGKEISRNMLKTAHLLNKVYERELFSSDFDSMEEYTKTCFNLSKSSMYNLIKIGKLYVQVNSSGQKYMSNLPATDGTEYTYSQIVQLLPLEYEEVKILCESNRINSNMTCRELKDFVKHYRNMNPADDTEDQEEIENVVDADYNEIPDESSDAMEEHVLKLSVYLNPAENTFDFETFFEIAPEDIKSMRDILSKYL